MVQYGDQNEYVFLGRDMARAQDYSEHTAQEIDTEVKRIINASYERAKTLIEANRDKLEIIAKSLIEHETLDGAQVEEIVRTGKFTPPPPPPPAVTPMHDVAHTPLTETHKPIPPKLDPGLGTPAPATA
ncbi:MAG: cell division protein FtsH, partial [Pedosphaera sp.]|nr:cell division protein FtsH [Pedosphaera sp.]